MNLMTEMQEAELEGVSGGRIDDFYIQPPYIELPEPWQPLEPPIICPLPYPPYMIDQVT